MSRKSLLKSESAAVVAVAAVLLLGLAFTMISVVKLNHAPEWKIDAEREYSYDAWSNMEDVKTRADLFTRFMESNENYPYGLSATVPFKMGGGNVPVFEPSKSNSKLAVNTEECTMSITFGSHTLDPVHCGGVTYYSENRQYPDQVFRYENGALILAQGDNSQMKRDPLFNITEDMGNYTVTMNAINLTGEPASTSSSTSTALRLTGCSVKPFLNSDPEADGVIDSFNLIISTHYIDAWATYLNNTAKEAGLEYDTDYKITYPDSDRVCLSFLPTGNKTYNIHVNQTVLCAELGRRGGLPGGVVPSGSEKINIPIPGLHYFETFTGKNTDSKNTVTLISPVPNPGLLGDTTNYSLSPNSQEIPSYQSLNAFSENLDGLGAIELNLGFENDKVFEHQPSNATVRMIYSFSNKNQNPTISVTLSGANAENFQPKNDNWNLYTNTFPISVTDPQDLILSIKVTSPQTNVKGTFSIDYLDIYLS